MGPGSKVSRCGQSTLTKKCQRLAPQGMAPACAEMPGRQRRAAMARSACSGHARDNQLAAHGVQSPPRPPSRQKTSGMHSPYLDIIKIIHFINLSGYDPFQRGPLPLFSLDMGVMLALLVLMSHGQRSVKTMCPHCLDPALLFNRSELHRHRNTDRCKRKRQARLAKEAAKRQLTVALLQRGRLPSKDRR